MKRIAICTFSRAEYGLLKQTIRLATKQFDTWLIAGAGHLSAGQGMSVHEVYADELVPKRKILLADFSPELKSGSTITSSVAQGLSSVAEILQQHSFDALVVMGDRYELFTVSIAALLHKIPLVHISGGEISEGAIDDNIRHATTKLSHLHLVANQTCALNVSHMGEEDWRITVTGEPGLDNIHNNDIATPEEVKELFGIDLSLPTLLVTLHPSTLEPDIPLRAQYTPLLEALKQLTQHQILITAPGAEEGSEEMISAYQSFADRYPHVIYIPHLGSRNYLSVLRHTAVVIGNSSSGLVEAPSLGIPCVNIGNRQKNRMAADTIIHCTYHRDDILKAIRSADTQAHHQACATSVNPYDPCKDGRNSLRVVESIHHFLNDVDLRTQLVKRFDLNTNPTQWNTLLP